jgi:hypothetical protein
LLSAIAARHFEGWTLRRARNCRFSASLNVASYARLARAPHGVLRLEQSHVTGAHVVAGDEMQQLTIETEHVRKQTTAERDRVSYDRLEHRLYVGRRGADHAKKLGGRCLLLPRFCELAGARFELLFQLARVRLELLFQFGAGLGNAAHVCSHLRSGRTKLTSVRSALCALARQRSPRPHSHWSTCRDHPRCNPNRTARCIPALTRSPRRRE